nr:hypothetical protein [Tanacetum cinerariifolium]
MRALTSVYSSSDDTSSSSQSCDSVMRALFLLENKLGAKALELRRASLTLTLLYLALKSLVFLISVFCKITFLATFVAFNLISCFCTAEPLSTLFEESFRLG